MSMLDTFSGRKTPRKIDVNTNGHGKARAIEDDIADIGKDVIAARERGDLAVMQAKHPPRVTLPPTAANVFATNALELLKKREEVLNEALMRASDLEMLAGEMISCGTRVQDFFSTTQTITQAIVEAKPMLAALPETAPSIEPQEGPAPANDESADAQAA